MVPMCVTTSFVGYFRLNSLINNLCLCLQCFVQKLDGFISWLQEALDSTENWMQPRQDLDSLRVYLDTHLVSKHVSVLVCVFLISVHATIG